MDRYTETALERVEVGGLRADVVFEALRDSGLVLPKDHDAKRLHGETGGDKPPTVPPIGPKTKGAT